MKSYESNPVLLGLGGFAAALATIGTLAVGVLLPLKFSASEPLVANAPAVQGPVELAIRYRIEVIGSRKANAA